MKIQPVGNGNGGIVPPWLDHTPKTPLPKEPTHGT
jgi:hypothetical protein